MKITFNLQFVLLSVVMLTSAFLQAQSLSRFKELAEEAFKRGNYNEAADYYQKSWPKVTKDKGDIFKAGISYFEANRLTEAIQAFSISSEKKKYRKASFLYLAKASVHQGDFRSAIQYYKKYYKDLSKKDLEAKREIQNEVLRCSNGIAMRKKEAVALIEAIGAGVNTVEDEYAVVPSKSRRSRIYFSAVREDNEGGKRNESGEIDLKDGKDRADIFFSSLEQGSWTKPQKANSLIQSSRNDQIIDLVQDGQTLIYFSGWSDNQGLILSDTFHGEKIQNLHYPIQIPMLGEIGDYSGCFFKDSLLVFSSKRMGGYGGYDLYLSLLTDKGWSRPINLGPKVNGPYHEICPYIAQDGRTVYFSSNNLQSIGGFDVFKTAFLPETGGWSFPEQMLMPINSGGDDLFFRLGDDAITAFMTSDRKNLSKGKRDVFSVYFKEERPEQLYTAEISALQEWYKLSDSARLSISANLLVFQDENLSPALIKTIDYQVDALYYKTDNILDENKNQSQLDKIIEILKLHPDLKLQIIAHSYDQSQSAVNLYSSLKRAELIRAALIQKRIDEKRLTIVAAGNSYPIAVSDRSDHVNTALSDRWNKRIEFRFFAPDSSPVRVHYTLPAMQGNVKYAFNSGYPESQSGIRYSILIGESDQLFSHPLIGSSLYPQFAIQEPNRNKTQYYIGNFTSFREAEQVRLKELGDSEAVSRLVVFYQGEKPERKKLIDYVLKQPDIILYMDYLRRN